VPTYGPNSPGTASTDSSVGSLSWSNPDGCKTSGDFSTASFETFAVATTHYLTATNFGFTIGAGETVDGIQIEWRRQANYSNTNARDSAVRVIKGGTIGSHDKASATNWGASGFTYASYGGASDLWGTTWADTDVEASTFGAALSATTNDAITSGQVDHCRITVYTSVPPPPPPPPVAYGDAAFFPALTG
jgi:hypothetical protein